MGPGAGVERDLTVQRIRLQPTDSPSPIEVTLERKAHEGEQRYIFRRDAVRLEVVVEQLSDDHGWLRIGAAILPFYTRRERKKVELWIRGKRYSLNKVDRASRGKSTSTPALPGGDITAAMPGTILKITVQAGDTFAPHQPLIIMESMKMEMTLSAPRPGRVVEVRCRIGQLVQMGMVLIKVEELELDGPTT